jgi:hypothetical protein
LEYQSRVCTFATNKITVSIRKDKKQNMMQALSKNQLLILGLILAGALSRLIPHAPNFTAIGSIALLGGALIKNKNLAFIAPFIALLISDLIINNVIYAQYSQGFTLFHGTFAYVYGAFLLSVIFGKYFLKPGNVKNMLLWSVVSALSFFLITNFASWFGNPMYAQNVYGLFSSYLAGLPFLGNQVLSTALYLFGIYGLYTVLAPQVKQETI